MSHPGQSIPAWSTDVLASGSDSMSVATSGDRLVDSAGNVAATIADGVVRFPIADVDSSISFYQAIGGARFHERRTVPFAMSSLDTPVYRGYIAELRPQSKQAIIVDVGGGDGRNAMPWLEWGYERVVVIDAAFDALARLADRVSRENTDWPSRLLLIEADVREIPLRSDCASLVQAIEALAYLNANYRDGLVECARLLAPDGRLFLADRDFESGLITRLLYGGGVEGLLSQADKREILDGNSDQVVASRCFTAGEFRSMVESAGLSICSQKGISALSLLLGYERSLGHVGAGDEMHLDDLHALLARLGREGAFLRSHVAIAERER